MKSCGVASGVARTIGHCTLQPAKIDHTHKLTECIACTWCFFGADEFRMCAVSVCFGHI